MMKKCGLAMLAAMLLLAACTTQGGPQTPAQQQEAPPAQSGGPADGTASEGTVELDFWARLDDKFDEKELPAFEEKYPGIKVTLSAVGKDYDDLMQKYMTAVASNTLPNVAMIGQRHGIPQLYDSGHLMAIEEFMDEAEQNDILPAFWERFTYKGKRVTVPFQSSMPVLYYNVDMFEENGLTPPETFDELVEVAKALTKDEDGDGITDIYGVNFHSDTAWYIQPLVWGYGSDVVLENGDVSVNNEGYTKVLQAIAQMVHVDGSMPANQHATAREDFMNGLSGMQFDSCASLSNITNGVDGKFEFDIALFPSGTQKEVPIGGNSLGIFASTPEKEAASWTVVQYMISPESIQESTLTRGYIPISQSCMETETIQQDLENPKKKTVIEQLQFLRGQAVNPADSTVWNETMRLLQEVEADPNADIGALLENFQDSVDRFLDDYAQR